MEPNRNDGDEGRNWAEDLTQPQEPAPRGMTDEEISGAVEEAPRPEPAEYGHERPPRSGGNRLIVMALNVVMLFASVAIAYAYVVQDTNPAVRDALAVAMGAFFIVLFFTLFIVLYLRAPAGQRLPLEEKGHLAHYGPVSRHRPVLNVSVDAPFVQYRATTVTVRIRNISDTEGIRIRFHSMDHVSPSSIDLPIPPGDIAEIKAQLVPIAVGEREISIEFADLFDAEGRLIPKFEANTLAVERFRYVAREPAFGGVTASQVRLLKTVVSVATALIVGSGLIVALFGEALGGLEQVVRTYIPMLVVLQVPVFYLYFALMNRLPS
ncbi:MAG: hypothetical protein ACTSVT_10665 [Candidatus Thorarchaeota archaeon]